MQAGASPAVGSPGRGHSHRSAEAGHGDDLTQGGCAHALPLLPGQLVIISSALGKKYLFLTKKDWVCFIYILFVQVFISSCSYIATV